MLRPKMCSISASAGGYVLHSYCETCRSANRQAARGVDPRYAAVGGHCVNFPPTKCRRSNWDDEP